MSEVNIVGEFPVESSKPKVKIKKQLCCFETKYGEICGKDAIGNIRWMLDLQGGDKWFLVPCCEDHR